MFPGKQHYQSVKSIRQTTVRRGSIFECLQQEAKLPLTFLIRQAENIEHFLLQILIMNSDTSSAKFYTIKYYIICFCFYFTRVCIKHRDIFNSWGSKWMMHCKVLVCFFVIFI